MKKHLFILFSLVSLLVLPQRSEAQSRQPVYIRDCRSCPILWKGTTTRDVSLYPLTSAGQLAFEAAVKNGAFTITTADGGVLPSGQKPGRTPPLPVTVGWLTGVRYSFNTTNRLDVEAAGESVQLKFEAVSGASFSGSNPDGVDLSSGNFYDAGGLDGQGSFNKQWAFGRLPSGSGGVPAVALRLTFRRASNQAEQVSYTFTPTAGASRALIAGGQITTPPSSTTTTPTNPTTPSTPAIVYNRSLVFGNSITLHGGAGAFIVNDANPARGMAATRPEKDFVRLLGAKLRTINPNIDHRTLATWNMGGQLDAATGPYIEDIITKDDSRFENETATRFSPVADWKPEIVYSRLGENVNDGEIAFIGQTRFQARYEALVGKMIAQNPSAIVILSTSVWDKPNFDQAMRQIAQRRNWKLAEFSGMWQARFTNGFYALGVYNNPGIDEHPDDDGMQFIADKLWDQTPKSTSSGSPSPGSGSDPPPVVVSPPVARTYNYPTVPDGQVGGWNGYNSSISSGGHDETRVVGDVYSVENSTVRLEVRRGYGCSVQLFDKANGKAIFNWFDWGRQSELCIYSGPKNFNFNRGNEEFYDIGYNPIVPGNIWNVPSQVIASGMVTGNDGITRHYSKVRMIQWASGRAGSANPPVYTDAWIEKWVGLAADGSVDIKVRVKFDRADMTFYDGDINNEGIVQEYPNMMTVSNTTRNYYYVGPNPYTNDQDGRYLINTGTRENNNESFQGGLFALSEPWTCVEYVPGRFVTMSTERFAATSTNLFNLNEGDSQSEFSRIGTYTACSVPLIMDPKGTWYHDYSFLVSGSVQAGRSWAVGKPQRHGLVPNWSFTQANGRNDWLPHKAFDQREPFTSDNWKPTFRVVDGSTGGSALESPYVIHKANQISKLYLRMKYSGPVNKWRLEFQRNGQRDRGLDSNRPNEMQARFPDGQANGITQAFEFPVQNDGQWHTYEINTSSGEWRGVIQRYKLKYALFQQAPNQNDAMEISYFGVNNPGN